MAINPQITAKLVLLGESAVGKSSIVLTYVNQVFREHTEATIGAAFLTQTINLGNRIVKFEIWDTAGQERYHSLAPMYYRGAQVAIVVYDITSSESFTRAKSWISELNRQVSSEPRLVIALAGNKHDRASDRKVTTAEAQEYADANDLLFMETSAKAIYNLNELFMTIAKKIPYQNSTQSATTGVNLGASTDSAEGNFMSGCCK